MNIMQFLVGWFYNPSPRKKRVIRYNEKEIISFRKKGYTQEQIAEATGLTKNQVTGILFKLIKEGKIQRKRLKKVRKDDVNSSRKRPV